MEIERLLTYVHWFQSDRTVDKTHTIRGRPLNPQSEPQPEMIAGVTLATNVAERELAVLRARLAAARCVTAISIINVLTEIRTFVLRCRVISTDSVSYINILQFEVY